jgi:hypothetical protein
VAKRVGTRTAEECCGKHMERSNKPAGGTKGQRKKTSSAMPLDDGGSAAADDGDAVPPPSPKLRARPGTLQAKKEMRQILDHENAGHSDDVFTSTPLRSTAAAPSAFVVVEATTVPQLVQPSSLRTRSGNGGLGTRSTRHSPRGGASRESLTPGGSSADDGGGGTPGLLKRVSRTDVDVYVGRALKQKRRKVELVGGGSHISGAGKGMGKGSGKGKAASGGLSGDLEALSRVVSRDDDGDDVDDDEVQDYYFSEAEE